MFILYAVLAGLVLGFLAGGRLSSLGETRLRWAPVMFVGLIAQVVLFSDAVAARVGGLGPVLYVASTLVVLAALIRNLRLVGIPLVVAGALSNLVAILANGGYMPTSEAALSALGRSAATGYSNSALLDDPRLAPLTDIFALPPWLPFANVFSVGDALIAVGIAWTIAAAMRRGPAGEGDGGPPRRAADGGAAQPGSGASGNL